jgi:simple sugar transport system permease protein
VIVENSMILLGIPTSYRSVFTGAMIIIGTGISAYQVMHMNKTHSKRTKSKEAA